MGNPDPYVSLARDDKLLAVSLTLEETWEGKVAPSAVAAAGYICRRATQAFVVGGQNSRWLPFRNETKGVRWQNRAHFYAVAARAMRNILVDFARARQQQKRDGGLRVELGEALTVGAERSANVIALDDALTTLAKLDQRQSQIVELRFFGGLTELEIAQALHVSPRTVSGEWRVARSWLLRELRRDDAHDT